MRQYPIWNDVRTDAYKAPKSFGSRETFMQTVNVGTSSKNSHEFATIEVSRYAQPDGSQVFVLFVDGHEVKRGRVLNGEYTAA